MCRAFPLILTLFSAISGADSLIKSTDGGRTWRSLNPPIPGVVVFDFQAPVGSRNLYALVGQPSGTPSFSLSLYDFAVFTSSDAGDTWRRLDSLKASNSTFASLAVVAGAADIIYLAWGQHDVWGGVWIVKSTDGGATADSWSAGEFTYPFATALWRGAYLGVDAANPDRLFLGPKS